MQRLAEHDLIYSRMLEVTEPFEIARYNSALRGFSLPETKLERFRIDMTGYSPEVAEEMGDTQYLDPGGINRRFIIISPEQRSLPVVHTAMSNTEELMHQFFEANVRAINAITIKDACYGEIEDSVFIVDDVTDLLGIETVEFKVKTGADLTGKANRLRADLDLLTKSEDLWRDDNAVQAMVDLAAEVGDIRQNEIVPQEVVFRHEAFWTSHFGGLYIFHDGPKTTVIGDAKAPGFRKANPWTTAFIPLSDMELVLDFLKDTGRLEKPRGSWLEQSGFLSHRVQMRRAYLMVKAGKADQLSAMEEGGFRGKSDLRSLERDELLRELRWVEARVNDWSELDDDDVEEETWVALLRGKPGRPDQWLVNRLLGEYVPWDFVAQYIFNKPEFYGNWPDLEDHHADFVAKTLRNDYLRDKRGLRRRLFALN
ncbi:MAG: DUF6638 family protein [Pseudomonadota bacterium]